MVPGVKKMSESVKVKDAGKRRDALDPMRSFIVQAPAGSGKTELLTQRLLTLLSKAVRPEEILAITFTRKAAGEMATRVMDSLERAASSGPPPESPNDKLTYDLARAVLARDEELGWDLLYNPSRLRVQTMDSFSNSIVRRLPLLSSLGSDLSVTDKGAELYEEAARRTAALVEEDGPDGEALRSVLSHLDNSMEGLVTRLVQMLGKRDQWMRHVDPAAGGVSEGELRQLLEGSIRNSIESVLEEAREEAAAALPAGKADEFTALASYAGANMAVTDPASPIAALDGVVSISEASADSLALWQGVRALLLKSDNEWRSPTTRGVTSKIGFPTDKKKAGAAQMKQAFMEVLEGLSSNEPLRKSLARIGTLPRPGYGEEDWEVLKSLLRLLMAADGKLREVFAEAGEVDFQAVTMAATRALGTEEDPTELLLALDMTLKHILVDEYQDTSRSQLELLRLLTSGWTAGDGRTLFVVGDPMQSIYHFREAEVGLFLDAAASGIGGVPLESLVLETNFRSTSGIVDWVNSKLAHAFAAEEDAFMGAITYAPAVSFKGRAGGPGKDEAVKVRLYQGRDDAAEAAEVIRAVKAVPAGETVAVLARSRSHLALIVDRLKEESIDFRSQELDPLTDRAVVHDLLSLTSALYHPMERVAWLAVLRAPWCGLALKDLRALTAAELRGSVLALLSDDARLRTLSKDGRRRAAFLREAVGKAMELRGRVEPRALVEGLWIELGGPGCYGGDNNGDALIDAEAFFRTLEGVSAAGDVETTVTLEERLTSLYASHTGSEGCRVDVMTIHKAKGLEFDHVIVPGLGKRSRPSEKKLLFWLEGRGRDLLLAPIERAGESSAVYDYIKGLYREKEALEKTRLLYVAVTRAKKGLYLFGHYEKDAAGDGAAANPLSLLSLIEDGLGDVQVSKGGVADAAATPAAPELKLKRLKEPWEVPEAEAPVEVEVASSPGVEDNEPVFDWAGEGVKHLGTVTHGYLCKVAEEGLAAWDSGRVDKERALMEVRLRGLGLAAAEAGRVAGECVSIVKKALTDDKARWILGEHTDGAQELALTGVVEGETRSVVIVRTFVDGEGTRWVVDYKVSLHKGSSVEKFLKSEKDRYRSQLERYEQVLRAGGETREIRKALYYPALKRWVEV